MTSRIGDRVRRYQAVKDFFSRRGEALDQALKRVDREARDLPLMEKLAVLQTINGAYADVNLLESRLGLGEESGAGLDRTRSSSGN